MDNYEKSLRRKMKRDTLIGIAIIGLIAFAFFAVNILL